MATQPENDWIDWAGGKSPADPDARIEVWYRNGVKTGFAYSAGAYGHNMWLHNGGESDIIAYRVVVA